MNRIKELRKSKNVTLQEVSEKTGISVTSLSFYEKGQRNPKIETWQKLANYFGVPMDYLQGSMSYLNYKKSEEARDRASYHIDKIEKIVIEALNEPDKSKENLEKYTKEISKEFDFIKKEFKNMQDLKP